MTKRFSDLKKLLVALLLSLCLLPGLAAAQPAEAAAAPPPSQDQVESLVRSLEDPEARARLVEQLKLLTRAGAEAGVVVAQEAESEVQNATSALLKSISRRLQAFGETALLFIDDLNQLPRLWDWALRQGQDPSARGLWVEVLANLALVLGAGYGAFYLMWLLLRRPYRAIARRPAQYLLVRLLYLLVVLLLNLLPIAAFAAVAYLTLGLVDPRELTRLVALAWINASIIVRLVLAVGRFLFAPHEPGLRLPALSDETAHYADIWIKRLTFTPVYGYFALQAALLLGLPITPYEALLRLLGLVVTALVIVFIVQNRAALAGVIRGGEGEGSRPLRVLRARLAQVWFLPAILYVLVLYGIWALAISGGFFFLIQATALTLGVLVVGYLALKILERVFQHGFHISRELKTRFPGLEARANRYIPTLHALCRGVVYIVMALAILQAWGLDTFGWFRTEPGRVLSATLASIAGIVAVSFIVWELTSSLIESYLAETDRFGRVRVRSGRTRTLLTVARNFAFVVLLVVAVLLILSELGVNIAPLIAGAGVLGIAIGFGSQKLVQDVITGVFILFEDLISVGDVVNVAGKGGVVEAVSIRNVRLRDLSGTVHTIPYSAIDTISNLTKDFSFYVFDVGVAYRESVDEVIQVLKQLGEELYNDPQFGPQILEPLEILGVDALADSAVIIKARIKTLPIKQWGVGREFNRRMKNRFDELGIEIPFPHTTVYFGEDKSGQAPPARIRMSPGVSAEPTPMGQLANPN